MIRYNGHKHKRDTGEIFDLAWSPDSRQVASSGVDGKVHVWRVRPA